MDIDAAENFDYNDEFHKELALLNEAHGTGYVTAIVWNIGLEKKYHKTGIVVCQHQRTLSSRRFSVEYDINRYTLKFLGKNRSVVSDYFD